MTVSHFTLGLYCTSLTHGSFIWHLCLSSVLIVLGLFFRQSLSLCSSSWLQPGAPPAPGSQSWDYRCILPHWALHPWHCPAVPPGVCTLSCTPSHFCHHALFLIVTFPEHSPSFRSTRCLFSCLQWSMSSITLYFGIFVFLNVPHFIFAVCIVSELNVCVSPKLSWNSWLTVVFGGRAYRRLSK